MKTYQDLLEAGQSLRERETFIFGVINDHKTGRLYNTARTAMLYYRQQNPTITRYEKIIHDIKGNGHIDRWSPNHKIASNFFRFAVNQENQYLLGNGVSFGESGTKERLGLDFDTRLQELGKNALIGGVAFGFWNFDHLEVFSVEEFCPLYDEENGSLRAGIRFWQIADNKPLRVTLYEEDGYTEYIKRYDGKTASPPFSVLKEKTPYILTVTNSRVDGTAIVDGQNYSGFPIVPLYANDLGQSEITGRQGTIDAFDLLNSNLVNNVDEGNLIYWVIKNAGGMDIEDDEKFLEQLHVSHIAHLDDDQDVTAQTLEAPYGGNAAALEKIRQQLYEDFMCFNVSDVSSGSKTATEILASYQLLDSKTDGYEYQVIEFIQGVLKLLGIKDKPTFRRSKVVNQAEEIQTLLQCSQYLDSDTITKQICAVLGIADLAQGIIEKMTGEDMSRFEIAAQPRQETAEEPEEGAAE